MDRLGTFFGFGTILSTGFIHMLEPATDNLSSPCLPASWTDRCEFQLATEIRGTRGATKGQVLAGWLRKTVPYRGAQPPLFDMHMFDQRQHMTCVSVVAVPPNLQMKLGPTYSLSSLFSSCSSLSTWWVTQSI